MWLSDLEKAVEGVKASKKHLNIEKVMPCWDGGVVFYTADQKIIKWFPDGTVTENGRGD